MSRPGFSTWLPLWIGAGESAVSVAVLLWHGSGDDGIRAVLRLTAHCSVLLFLAAFGASSFVRLRPTALTRRLLAGRRQVGLSFAASHLVHGVAILALLATTDFSVDPVAGIVGGLGYVAIAALAITSSDRAVRALGGPAWRRLHLAGSWYLWFVFLATYGPVTATGDPAAILFSLALVTAALLRPLGRRGHATR